MPLLTWPGRLLIGTMWVPLLSLHPRKPFPWATCPAFRNIFCSKEEQFRMDILAIEFHLLVTSPRIIPGFPVIKFVQTSNREVFRERNEEGLTTSIVPFQLSGTAFQTCRRTRNCPKSRPCAWQPVTFHTSWMSSAKTIQTLAALLRQTSLKNQRRDKKRRKEKMRFVVFSLLIFNTFLVLACR